MAKTAIADIIVPTEFENYTIERTAKLTVQQIADRVNMATRLPSKT